MVDYFNILKIKWKDSKLIHKLSRVCTSHVHDKDKPATEWQVVNDFVVT